MAGLHFEYTVNGTLTGGLMVQPQTVFSPGETVTAAFPLDPERPPVRDSVPFGLYLAVVAEDGTQFPVPVYCQWEADLETPCTLTLQGSKTVGYTLSADGKSPVLTLTPYSQLSQDQIPF